MQPSRTERAAGPITKGGGSIKRHSVGSAPSVALASEDTGRGRRLDHRRRARYGKVFDTLAAIDADLSTFEPGDSDASVEEAVMRLRTAFDATRNQLRTAMRQGYREDGELDRAIRMGWGRARAQLLILSPNAAQRSDLSPREVEVLRRLSRGLANKQIAAELGISARTVRNHVSSIYGKLHLASRAEAAVLALTLGVIEP